MPIVAIKKSLHKSFVFLIKLLLLFYPSLQQGHILCCSCSIISQNHKQNMYLLTESESQTGKYLAQNQDVRIESQIFSRPAQPNSSIRILSMTVFSDTANPHWSVRFSSRAVFFWLYHLTSTALALKRTFFIWFFTEIALGPCGSYYNR